MTAYIVMALGAVALLGMIPLATHWDHKIYEKQRRNQ
jgi:hypothetical protein